ncbi:MAG: CinA family protein [Clostridia bacterium]|nr:CinA family protein [Clostridia bacterium]
MTSQTLKLYGLTVEEIEDRLKNLDYDKNAVKTYVKEKYLDAFLYVESKGNDELYTLALSKIVKEFEQYIYADRDVSLYERLYEVLVIRNKTVSLMEQATGGILTNNLMAFDGAEKIVKVSYMIPSIKGMIDHFDLNPFKFTVNHGVSNETAFDIASSIRSKILSDLYIVCVSTLAEGNDLYYNNSSYTAYVAIGSAAGVKLFKVDSDLKKRDFMNQVAKTICFKLINILK